MTSMTPVLTLSNTAQAAIANTTVLLDSYYIYNPNSNVAYIQFIDRNTPGNVTVGTTSPKWSPGIPANSAANLADLSLGPFSNGIMVAVTSTANGSVAMPLNITASLGYK
jgi:hypothetical protein